MVKGKISIVITCYNLGMYLEEAISSIKESLLTGEIEVILVNDGSTDSDTIQVLEDIKIAYPLIIILDQQNQGLAKARNNGIKLAKGKYIIPLDADNKLRPELIKKTIDILDCEDNIDVVHGNAQFFGDKTAIWQSKSFEISEMVLNNYIDACAGFRKSAWEQVGGFDENMPIMGFEDWDLWLRMSARGFQFKYVNEILFDYRVRKNSMLTDAWKKRSLLLEYIFNKPELVHLGVLRSCLIENKQLKQEPSFKTLLIQLLKKVKKRVKF